MQMQTILLSAFSLLTFLFMIIGRSGLRDALRAVPEHMRLPLLLHHMEGYSLQEVADMLHISVAAARGRVYQARQKLRQQLDKEEQQP